MSEASEADLLPLFPLAHDLRQPLRAIVGAAQRLLRQPDGVAAPVEAALAEILRAARRQDALLASIVEFDAAGELAGGPAVPPAVVVQGACLGVEAYRLEQGGVIVVRPEGGVPGSKTKVPAGVEKALEKVLHNALKFHEPGAAPQVRIDFAETDEAVEFRVRDAGIGVDVQFAEKVFEPFMRLHSLDRFDGAGLGLTIARRSLRRLGGSIFWQDPHPDAGSLFVIRLSASHA